MPSRYSTPFYQLGAHILYRSSGQQNDVRCLLELFARRAARAERLKLSQDPKFEQMVRDVVGLYGSPTGNTLPVVSSQE